MITYRETRNINDCLRAKLVIGPFNELYPNFDDWYINKAVPDIFYGHGSLILAENGDEIVGAILGKKDEPKIRCLRVVPGYQNKGIALHLIDRMLKTIGNDKPLVTVAEPMLHGLSRILVNRYDFNMTSVHKGLYKPKILEYFFNEVKP